MSGTFKKGSFKTEIVNQNAAIHYLVDNDGDTSETRSKAEEAESKFNEAIHLTEKRTGSLLENLLVFQEATEEDIVELGRPLPNLSAEHSLNDDGGSVNNVGSLRSDKLKNTVDARPEKESESFKPDDRNAKDLPQKEEKQRFKERKWDKLRNTVDARPEKEKENSKPDDRNPRDLPQKEETQHFKERLRQLSWEAMSDTSKNDTEDEESSHLPQKEEKQRSKEKKWDKLRNTVDARPEKEKENSKLDDRNPRDLPQKDEKQRFKERKWDKLRNTVDARPEKEKENSKPDDRSARDFRRRLSFFLRKPFTNQTRRRDEGNRLVVRTATRNQTTIQKTSDNHCCDPAGESLEVVAYSSSEGKFHVLPPFPSKMI
jgi:hypothetical protein